MLERKNLKHIGQYVVLAVLLEIIIESLNRKSFFAGVGYLFDRPLLFAFNTLIILLTLSVATLFKREVFVASLVSMVWAVFGIANFVILQFRVTPFSAVDFGLIKTAISVSGHYLSVLNIAMIIVAFCLLVFSLLVLYRKAPCHKVRNRKRVVFSYLMVICIAVAIFFIKSTSSSVQALSTNYTNISEAYENYGFAYCFTNSIIDTGISKPDDYSQEKVQNIVNSLENEESSEERPNVIMIQLESFFDADYLTNVKTSEDPIPVFHNLQKNYSSGLLTVPTVGAGTVNTEFEILTGMRQHDFGVSEYPYKTVLKQTTSESICTDLSELGYSTHCVHNNEATFYGRNKVFANLGFDTFTSIEYMNGTTENPNGWVKDDILTKEIIKTLDSTDGSDFTFGITVQSHGKYDVVSDKEYEIKVTGAPEGKESQYEYYVSQIADVDGMIGELISELEKRDEKTLLVLYGDHLPSLDITELELKNKNLYQTQYVTWNNFGLEKIDKGLYSYQLYPTMLDYIDIHQGVITKYHQQTRRNTDEYKDGLTTLAYDLFYGDNYAYNGYKPFVPTNIKMGTDEFEITGIKKYDSHYIVSGKGFTPYTKIYFNEDKLETEFIDSEHVCVYEDIAQTESEDAEADVIAAYMVDEDGIVLSQSRPEVFEEVLVD